MIQIGIGLMLNGLDLATGMMAALKNRELMSEKLRSGLFKKSGFIACYILGFICDHFGKYIDLNLPVNLLTLIVSYVFITELTSILENVHKLNKDILPEALFKFFKENEK